MEGKIVFEIATSLRFSLRRSGGDTGDGGVGDYSNSSLNKTDK